MIVGIYKPKGPTSNRVLSRVKKVTGIKKVGHAGTLDPLAEGVLVVAIGRQSTKKIAEQVQKEKEYLAKIKLGVFSETDDEEGAKEVIEVAKSPDPARVEEVLKEFVGEIEQLPPIYSAIKIDGKEAYKYARKGLEVVMQKRKAIIKEIELIGYNYPELEIRVVTGPGVYIRTLARDIGTRLETGGYLAGLIRTRVGDFPISEALQVDELKTIDFTPFKSIN